MGQADKMMHEIRIKESKGRKMFKHQDPSTVLDASLSLPFLFKSCCKGGIL